ncbi:hypothetical protein E3N88_00198 [Mikania micrantha]|uniref:Uncharacterized protein n=1 Tax=Mikania micrantha TaxID=192012 RepID=A0A5N6PXU6_9ASTR|nr:hypothetical protein E3N88_00198 [Mikania micrantha]
MPTSEASQNCHLLHTGFANPQLTTVNLLPLIIANNQHKCSSPVTPSSQTVLPKHFITSSSAVKQPFAIPICACSNNPGCDPCQQQNPLLSSTHHIAKTRRPICAPAAMAATHPKAPPSKVDSQTGQALIPIVGSGPKTHTKLTQYNCVFIELVKQRLQREKRELASAVNKIFAHLNKRYEPLLDERVATPRERETTSRFSGSSYCRRGRDQRVEMEMDQREIKRDRTGSCYCHLRQNAREKDGEQVCENVRKRPEGKPDALYLPLAATHRHNCVAATAFRTI